jgi:SAM-dependent methyltransferase
MESLLKTTQDWHQRYLQQTRWTRALASYLFQRAGLSSLHSILEVGCGTGAVLQEIIRPLITQPFGLDINPNYLAYTAQSHPQSRLILGDAHQLPLADGCFDVCLCHYLLLWVSDPSRVIQEMVRVTRSGGVVIALAEPDYGNRIDYPQDLSLLGKWQMDSLEQQGADPLIGRKLRAILSTSGLLAVEAGVQGGEWRSIFDQTEFDSEWDTIQSDLANQPEKLAQLPRLMEIDMLSCKQGKRILYVPTFYAWGRVP